MKKYKMQVIEGIPTFTNTVIYSYRGHRIIQKTRDFDPRNLTRNGYDWEVQFSTGEFYRPIGRRTRAAAKSAIDAREART